jgi:hypothetical protein
MREACGDHVHTLSSNRHDTGVRWPALGKTCARSGGAQIDRAETISERAAGLDSIVTMGSWVTFWVNSQFPRETRQLVYGAVLIGSK